MTVHLQLGKRPSGVSRQGNGSAPERKHSAYFPVHATKPSGPSTTSRYAGPQLVVQFLELSQKAWEFGTKCTSGKKRDPRSRAIASVEKARRLHSSPPITMLRVFFIPPPCSSIGSLLEVRPGPTADRSVALIRRL